MIIVGFHESFMVFLDKVGSGNKSSLISKWVHKLEQLSMRTDYEVPEALFFVLLYNINRKTV
jgi:hypothetical protein